MTLELDRVFDLNKNVFIEACAGAGKTWLLSKRFAVIMDDFARQYAQSGRQTKLDPSNILVITFTRKAAAEMSERIYKDINKLLNDEPLEELSDGFGQNLRQAHQDYKMHVRATYSRNAISTIDAFCAQILREQAEQVELDPEFRIQDEADTQRMVLETWERYLRECSENRDPHLEVLLDHLSVFHINEYIHKLHSHAELMQPWLKAQSGNSPENLASEFRAAHPLPALNPQIETALLTLSDSLPDPADMIDPTEGTFAVMQGVKTYLQDPHPDQYTHRLKMLEFLRQLTLTQDRSKYRNGVRITSKVWPDEFVPLLRESLKQIQSLTMEQFPFELLAEQLPSEGDLIACTVNHHLAHFYLGYHEVLSQRLRRENVLSFEEIILRTHELLKKPEIAEHYGQRFKHILFDEFQDTNDLRWNIVRLIAESGKGALRKQGLFIVGDTKQSIYRFNQADVQVMNRVRQHLIREQAWDIRANETYRSSRAFVRQVINPLMRETFPAPEKLHDLELYETVFEESKAAARSPLTEYEHGFSRCSVHAVLGDGRSVNDIVKTGQVAQFWIKWLASNELHQEKAGPQVGILLRTFTHILDYINIFTQMGLNFEVVASKGLFQQQECYDIYHWLSVLVNPQDDLALVALLRSPFFIFTDQQIQTLRDSVSLNRRSGWCWQALREGSPDIAAEITAWQLRSAREPVDRLLTDLLSSERQLGWISETGGLLRVENMKKLIHLAHNLSLDGLSLREIVEYFKFQIQHGDAPQAEIPGGRDIQILTIHKAKGLEFPVVITPELHADPRNGTSGMYLGELDGYWQAGITLDAQKGSIRTLQLDQIKAQNTMEEAAENRRLFYVAVTRAKYGISFILKVHPNRRPAAESWWARYIHPVLDLPLDKDLIQDDPQQVRAAWQALSTPEMEYDFTLEGDSSIPQRADKTITFRSVEPVTTPLIYQEISPHTIMSWVDPHPAAGSDERQKGEDLGLATSALTFGRLLHRVMEMSWVDTGVHRQQIEAFLIDEGVEDLEQQALLLQDLEDCLGIYRESQLAARLSRLEAANRLPELPVFGYLKNDTHVYKVNGIVDLLYKDGDEWVVLDYKTDKVLPKEIRGKDYAYWFQIQTYLWILNLLYGIKARGALYFNRFDQIVPIDFEPELYFLKLSALPQARDLQPFLPQGTQAPDALLETIRRINRDQGVVILEPTQDSCERLAQSLAHEGLLFPNLSIRTLSELKRSIPYAGRQLTPYLARMGVAKLLGKRPQWGIVNRLAEAFYKATQGEQVIAEKRELYASFLAWCNDHQILTSQDMIRVYPATETSKLVIDNLHATSPHDYALLEKLSQSNETIFLSPLRQGQAISGFGMQPSDWMLHAEAPAQREDHTLHVCYGVQEEVDQVAHEIGRLVVNEVPPERIQIAVSSMERYVPAIKRIFSEHGISVRLSKREPVMERPVTHLAFALIQGIMSPHPSWDEAMAVWLNPLVCRPGKELNQRQLLDLEVRKLGFAYVDPELPVKLKKLLPEGVNESLSKAANDLVDFMDTQWLANRKMDLATASDWLLEMLRSFEFTYLLEPGSVASKAYTSLKNAIEGVKRDWRMYLGSAGGIQDLKRELRERLHGVEVSSSQQGFGVDVVSFLDTLNQRSEHLFILGLSEGQFPVHVQPNPFLKPSLINPWFLNLTLFKSWLAMEPERVRFSAPQRDIGGEAIQISTFGQYLKEIDAPLPNPRTQSEQFRGASGKRITAPNSRWHVRHNTLLDYKRHNPWMGVIGDPFTHLSVEVSASAFDDILKCPQRYWYARYLQLEAAETDIAQRQEIEIGNLVHRVLEGFGKAGGFVILAKDLQAALVLLEDVAGKVMAGYEVDPSANLLHQRQSRDYFTNMLDPELNLLAALINLEQPYLTRLSDAGLHEQSFGYAGRQDSWPHYELRDDSITLILRGQIDRIFNLGDHVWATDYKTGKISLTDTREFWTSQLYFYYLVLSDRYPHQDIILTYEQLRSFKKAEWGIKGYVGDISGEHPITKSIPTRGQLGLAVNETGEFSKAWIISETLGYAQPLLQNHFPLTQRDEAKACAYCPFDRVCRKTALPRA